MTLANSQGATQDPAAGLQPSTPATSPLVKLGEILFFSKTLGGTFDSSCASCHHPVFAGGDALSLPVGVAAVNPDYLGPGRLVNNAVDNDPLKDGGPNVPRNSQTIINSSLYKSELFFDGRVELLRASLSIPGSGVTISTPDSNNLADPQAGATLLEAQSRFPSTSPDEMRNFLHPELNSTESFRALLVSRLKGQADTVYMSAGASSNWLALFQSAFGSGTADSLITYNNIQKAIAAYESSLVFVDTPWRDYVAGNKAALSDQAKQGALLFMQSKAEGGLGCSACHSGSFFTNEKFYNTGVPQIGRGKRVDGTDFGRWQVTKQDDDKFAFRVPSLINIALTAPYGHDGAFQTLEDMIRYHANPKGQIGGYDFTLQHLGQFQGKTSPYANAAKYTQDALSSPNFASELPGRDLTADEVAKLLAFLNSLSSQCLNTNLESCLSVWVPSKSEDPDGNLLVRSTSPSAPIIPPGTPTPPVTSSPYATPLVSFSALPGAARSTFPEVTGCSAAPVTKANNGNYFAESGSSLGLTLPHGYDSSSWLKVDLITSFIEYQSVMTAGGVTAGYLDGDCWPDLVYTSGTSNGVVIYKNNGGSNFTLSNTMPPLNQLGGLYTGVAIADLAGDYRHELVLGNLTAGNVVILKPDDSGQYQKIAQLPMTRNTFGISFGDFNGDGFPEIFLGHWDANGLPGTAPAFWKNNGGVSLSANDKPAGLSVNFGVNQAWQFTPAFVDADDDGLQDLLVATDFGSTMVFKNGGQGVFSNVTDRSVITDENGMGSALGDFRNVGKLDWFVSAVYDPTHKAAGNWGVHGNRMYRNDSTPGTIKFTDVTDAANVRNGLWGWGVCAADFNNDGWLDIFQVDGFGYTPSVSGLSAMLQMLLDSFTQSLNPFTTKSARLFINKGDGTFTEQATNWHIDLPMDGRGLTCFDYDHDGDVDVAVLDHSKGIKFFENQSGSGAGHRMLSIRLVGNAPNTDALGAKVYVTADLNGNGSIDANETQMRVAAANSNFNSQNLPDLFFGLGQANVASQVKVVWPNGQAQTFTNVAANQFLTWHQP